MNFVPSDRRGSFRVPSEQAAGDKTFRPRCTVTRSKCTAARLGTTGEASSVGVLGRTREMLHCMLPTPSPVTKMCNCAHEKPAGLKQEQTPVVTKTAAGAILHVSGVSFVALTIADSP